MKTMFGLVSLVAALSLASIGPAFATGSFSLSSNCPDGTYPITCGPVVVTVTSLNGFAGTVSLSTSVTPSCTTGYCLTPTVSPNSVSVISGGSAKANVTFNHSCNFRQNTRCIWTVTVTGVNGNTNSSTQVFVCYGSNCPV